MDVVYPFSGAVAGGAAPGSLRRASAAGVNAPGYRRAARHLALLFALLVVPGLHAADKDPVIYPRGSAPADAPAAAGRAEGNSSLYLAVALLAGAGGWWLWLKRRGGVRGGLAAHAKLSIAETKSLGSRQYLVVADYDGKKYLLGVCPGSIELLTPLEAEKGKDA